MNITASHLPTHSYGDPAKHSTEGSHSWEGLWWGILAVPDVSTTWIWTIVYRLNLKASPYRHLTLPIPLFNVNLTCNYLETYNTRLKARLFVENGAVHTDRSLLLSGRGHDWLKFIVVKIIGEFLSSTGIHAGSYLIKCGQESCCRKRATERLCLSWCSSVSGTSLITRYSLTPFIAVSYFNPV